MPGHTIYVDFVGPLVPGRFGVRYVHCIVDSAMRVGDAYPSACTDTSAVLRALERWSAERGYPKRIVADNAAYYESAEMGDWCHKHRVHLV